MRYTNSDIMLGEASRIRSGICDVILGFVTKRHMKRDIIFIEEKNISDKNILLF